MRKECVSKVETELGRPLDAGEQAFIDKAIVDQLRAASSRNRSTYKVTPYATRIRQAGARAAQQLRGYRYKGDSWSAQDKADLKTAIEREVTAAGGKLDITLDDDLGGSIAQYEDRAISFALNQIEGKTVNGIIKALQGTLSHELLHWARSMGFYDAQQWAELVSASKGLRMTKGDAQRAGEAETWQVVRDRLKHNPTYAEVAAEMYSNRPQWVQSEEAVAAAMEAAAARYEQANVDKNDTIWRKALGVLIKAGRAVAKAIGAMTKSKQAALRSFIEAQERDLRSGKTSQQPLAFDPAGRDSQAQKVKVAAIKPAVAEALPQEEIEDLVRRVEGPNISAAQIAAAPIWETLADGLKGPTINGEQAMDPEWWDKRQYPHPDGGNEMLTPYEMAEYVRSMYESRAAKKIKQKRKAIIVTGAPGAGKSSITRQLAKKAGAAVIEADTVMPLIPEYNEGMNAEDVFGESSAISAQAVNWLIKDGTNIVHERIGDDVEVLQKYIGRLKQAGYSVDVVHVRMDFTTRMRRMAARFLATGRSIPVDTMIRIGNNPTKVYRTAARLQMADGFYEVESGKGTDRRYKILGRSGKPSPGTSKGVTAAAGGGMARVGRAIVGQRPTPGLKEKAVAYAREFQEWNKTAGFSGGAMANFGGVKAKGADLTALSAAKQMAKDGVDANTIRHKTGWFRPKGGKGKWRFTLASGDIKLKPFEIKASARKPQVARLSDLIDSPVFDQYPQLKKTRVLLGNFKTDGGSNRMTNEMFVSNNAEDRRVTIAHEMQHLISGIEHFERGGSPLDIVKLLEVGKGWNVEPPEWALSYAEQKFPNQTSTMARALSLYLALADEVQARDAERMLNMSAAERLAFEPSVLTQETIRAEDIQNAWEHLRSMPLKLIAAIGPAGFTIYQLAHTLINFFSAQSFTPKDAFNLPEVIAAAGQSDEDAVQPGVHQEFGLTKEQSAKFDKMRAFGPAAKAFDAVGLPPAPKKITRSQYAKLRRLLDAISDEDFLADNMRPSQRIVALKQVKQYLKDEKAFKAFLEHGVLDGGFVGIDKPTIPQPMESRKYTPPGGRFGATSSATPRTIIGPQPGFLDDAAYVAAQLAAKPTTTGIGGSTIQDKRMQKLKPWNVALGKLDEVDKLVEGSLKAMWKGVFANTPVLNQIAGKASTYFQFGGVPDQAALEIYRMLFQGRVGKAEELAAEMARDVSKGLKISYEDAFRVLRGDMSGLAKLDQSVRAQAADQMWQLKKVMTEADPVKQAADLAKLPPELQAAGQRAMQAIQEVGDALVEHRIISAKQRDKWNGHYLLRAYMEHFDSYRPPIGTRASGAPYRAWREGIPKDKRLTKGEIEDLPFLLYMSIERPLHDIAAYSYLNALIHHNQTSPSSPRWFLPESLVLFGGKWRSVYYIANQMKLAQTSLENKRAELTSLGGASAGTAQTAELVREIAALQRVIADMQFHINANPQYAQALNKGELPDGYKQLPMETSKYGDAAGAIVINRLYDDITGGEGARADPDSVAGKAQEAYTSFNRNIKFLLTVANPPTHLRNIYSNILMLARSGTNAFRVVEAIRDLADHYSKRRTSPAVAAAIKFGAMKQTFTEAELRVLDEFARKLENELKKAEFRKLTSKVFGQGNTLDNILGAMDTTNAVMGAIKNAYGDGMSWLYQHEDVIFKIAKIADELERGTPEALAAAEARKYFFDYSAVTPVVRWLSNTAIAPFIRYTYFAVPNFLEQVATSPWRLMYTGYGQYLALMALASLLWGFAPEDAKKTLNEYLEERPMLMPVPWRDEHGRIQWIDLGYTLPEGALWGLFSATVSGNPWEALRAFGMTGGPLATIYAGISTGVDPFRGAPIYEETDDDQTRGLKQGWFVARSFMPSLYSYYLPPLPGEIKGGPGYEAFMGTGTDRYGEPTQTNSQLMARVLGVNVYPNDVPYGQDKRIRQFDWVIGQIERDIARAEESAEYTDERREQILNSLYRRLDQVLAERDEYITATAEAVEAEIRRQNGQ